MNPAPHRRAARAAFAAAVLALAACSTDEPLEPDCVSAGYPCTWPEVDPAVVERTDEIGRFSAQLMQRVQSIVEVAAFLESVPGMAEVQSGDLAVRFRLEGGRPGWIMLPVDPDNPRLGGAPGTVPWDVDDWLLSDEDAGIVGAIPGEGKQALVLSPYEWQMPGKTVDIVRQLEVSRDYGAKHGGAVAYHANLAEGTANPQGPMQPTDSSDDAETRRRLDGHVSVDDFRGWRNYNYVYLSTHGAASCGEDGKCHTVLSAGQVMDGATALAVEQAPSHGYDPVYTATNLTRGLTKSESARCVAAIRAGEKKPRTGATPEDKPCLTTVDKDYAVLGLTADFFIEEYGTTGLDNVVVFLAACQSLKLDDLRNTFIQAHNHDVAVFGYDEVVYSSRASEVGLLVTELMTADDGPAMDSQAIIEHIQGHADFASETFDGHAQGPDDRPHKPARFVDRASNPTHARDVVELVDPATGEELEDGGSVATVDADGDGVADGIRVGMRVRGIRGRDSAGEVEVYLEVDGQEVAGPLQPSSRVAQGVFDVPGQEVALGFDPASRSPFELSIRAELEGGAESRWTYEDIRAGDGFSYQTEGDLRVRAEGAFPGVIAASWPPAPDCVVHLPFHVPGMDHSLRLAARLPEGLQPGRYEVAKSYTGNPGTKFGALDYDFAQLWITASPQGENLTAGMFHAAMSVGKAHGGDDRDDTFVSDGGTVTVDAFDGKRLELAFSIELLQVAPDGPWASEMSPEVEQRTLSGYPFHGPAAKDAGRRMVEENRAAFASNPPRRSARVTGRLSHVISGSLSPHDIYLCKQPINPH